VFLEWYRLLCGLLWKYERGATPIDGVCCESGSMLQLCYNCAKHLLRGRGFLLQWSNVWESGGNWNILIAYKFCSKDNSIASIKQLWNWLAE
jgi:hypothetical protein